MPLWFPKTSWLLKLWHLHFTWSMQRDSRRPTDMASRRGVWGPGKSHPDKDLSLNNPVPLRFVRTIDFTEKWTFYRSNYQQLNIINHNLNCSLFLKQKIYHWSMGYSSLATFILYSFFISLNLEQGASKAWVAPYPPEPTPPDAFSED